MTDRDALLAAIADRPDDDTPRLVYADWCDDHDEPARAEFIRVQCGLARMGKPRTGLDPDAPVGLFGERERRFLKWGKNSEWGKKRAALQARLRNLFTANLCRWEYGQVVADGEYRLAGDNYVSHEVRHPILWYHRGFISTIRVPTLATLFGGPCGRCGGDGIVNVAHPGFGDECPACNGTGTTTGIAAEVWRRHPVTRVVVADREPEDDCGWMWFDGRVTGGIAGATQGGPPATLPGEVFDHLPGPTLTDYGDDYKGFPDRPAAIAALSDAIVAHGRALAGLK